MFEKEITFDRFVRGALFVAVCLLALAGIRYLSGVLIPFAIAWVVAYMLYPIVCFLQYKCRLRNRVVAVLVTLLLVFGAIGGLLYLAVPPMISECVHLKDVALRYLENGSQTSSLPSGMQELIREQVSRLNIEEILKKNDLLAILRETLPKVWNVVWSTANVIFSLVSSLIALLYLFFFLIDYEKIAQGWPSFVPASRRGFVKTLVNDVEHGMSGYFRGQALVALSNCIMFSVGFTLVGFPMPVALGVFIGIISFVPYLQLIGFLPALVLALLKTVDSGDSFWLLMGSVVLVYCVVQVIQDAVVTPKIMGKIMGLSPAIVLLSLSVWGYLMGVIGLIIALPLTTLLISYYKRYIIKDEEPLPTQPPSEEAEEVAESE